MLIHLAASPPEFLFLTGDEWEGLRNWLATLGGLIALGIGLSTYRRNVRNKREEQARLVYSKLTHVEHHDPGATFPLLPNEARMGNGSPGVQFFANPDPESEHKSLGLALLPLNQVTVIIHNGSKELIGPARVQMVNGGNGKVWDEFSISVGAVDPESNYVVDFTWVNEFHPGMPSLATTVIFRDASGQWWRRHRSEPIERVHDDPENEGPTAVERVHIKRYQEQIGVPTESQIEEPKLTLRVRAHRAWRKAQGKSPIP